MSENRTANAQRPRGGGPFGQMGMPTEKSMTFGPSAKRLLGRLRPDRVGLIWVVILAALGTLFSVLGPKLLGDGTNIIFAGSVSSGLPAGATKQQVIDGLVASGDTTTADFFRGLDLRPGEGIDFYALSMVLVLVLTLYILSSVFSWIQGYVLNGIVQRTVYRLRGEVEDKINRLPLKYFDKTQRGELLSRVTNDIDNISQTLQQTLSQLLGSLLMVVGVLVMMFVTSWLLALIALVTIPLTLLITAVIA